MSFDRRDEYDDRPRAAGRDEPPLSRENQDRAADRDNVKAKARIEYRAHAIERGCERVRETEETTVTPAMRRIEADDPDRSLTGLEFRLKGKDRIEEKVSKGMAERSLTIKQAFGEVKDAIRYTFLYPEDRYAEGVRADCQRLKDAGFEPVDRKNSWAAQEYKGINSRWQIPENGQVFEVQFHTRASFEAKQETHAAYERLRVLPDDHEEVYELRAHQREVSANIPMPPDVLDIQDYR